MVVTGEAAWKKAAAEKDNGAQKQKGKSGESDSSASETEYFEQKSMSAQEQAAFLEALKKMKKGDVFPVDSFQIKEGETSPPRRYNSGSMILAMENAGQLIEDEELRAQIKGCGIGTSATRAEILKKLFNINYLNLNGKTQIITPTMLGEMIYEVVNDSIVHLLNPELTASWEKGLTYVAEGTITTEEYMQKLSGFIVRRTENVRRRRNVSSIQRNFQMVQKYYK